MKIIMEDITKEIDNNVVLDNINLIFESGKIYGLIGRNGSGKSMILKTICGFLPPNTGKVYIDEEDIYKNKSFPHSIAALLDKPVYLPDLNAYDNLKMISSVNNSANDEQIKNALDIVNLANDKKIFKKFSLGMKQKLGIAQVIMEDSDIMILDEPFNGIEEETTQKLRDYLKNQRDNGKLIIVASHIKEDIETLCDQVYEIKLGKVKN